MGRAVFGEVLLFFVPFVLFALYLMARRRSLIVVESWSNQAVWLMLAGLALVAGALLFGGLAADRPRGAFVPTHLENGRLVPGAFK